MVALHSDPLPLIEQASLHVGTMRALSLHQPWASAVVYGLKVYETRPWRTSFRGLLVIHAAKTTDAHYANVFASEYPALRGALPSGAMLGIVELMDCVPVEQIRDRLSPQERRFGNYQNGRFAWKFRLVERFAEPYPARGQQGFFAWTRPALTPTPGVAPIPVHGEGEKKPEPVAEAISLLPQPAFQAAPVAVAMELMVDPALAARRLARAKRYAMLPSYHAVYDEFVHHDPVWWKHAWLPGQIKDMEQQVEKIAQDIAADQQKLKSAETRVSAMRKEFSVDAVRHEQRIREREERIMRLAAGMRHAASEGKRIALLMVAYKERLKEGEELGL